jgi:hypothetical protein
MVKLSLELKLTYAQTVQLVAALLSGALYYL